MNLRRPYENCAPDGTLAFVPILYRMPLLMLLGPSWIRTNLSGIWPDLRVGSLVRIGYYKYPKSVKAPVKHNLRQVPSDFVKPRRPSLETLKQSHLAVPQAKHRIAHIQANVLGAFPSLSGFQ
jgi:hypothetical protein